jgi:hypothetical protein
MRACGLTLLQCASAARVHVRNAAAVVARRRACVVARARPLASLGHVSGLSSPFSSTSSSSPHSPLVCRIAPFTIVCGSCGKSHNAWGSEELDTPLVPLSSPSGMSVVVINSGGGGGGGEAAAQGTTTATTAATGREEDPLAVGARVWADVYSTVMDVAREHNVRGRARESLARLAIEAAVDADPTTGERHFLWGITPCPSCGSRKVETAHPAVPGQPVSLPLKARLGPSSHVKWLGMSKDERKGSVAALVDKARAE